MLLYVGSVHSDDDSSHSVSHDPLPTRRLTKPASVCIDSAAIQICPQINCPEKIIICFDVSNEMQNESFRSRAGDKFTPTRLAKRALGIFLRTKHQLNRQHEFALVLLREDCTWLVPFTSDPDKLLKILDEFELAFETETFDMSSLFDTIHKNVNLPHVSDPTILPPPYTVRVVLFYGRSHCLPKHNNTQSFKLLLTSPHFFIDAFYIHEAPSDDNQCAAIFDSLCALDVKGLSYIFEVSRNPTRLYDCVAQLLPHPLQRPIQADASYKLQPKET